MKRFGAVFLSIMFIFLSGCEKNASEYISDINEFFESRIFSSVKPDEIDIGETVTIDPNTVLNEYRKLLAYNKLSKNQKCIYLIMQKAVEDMELRLIDVTKYSSENLYPQAIAAQRALICDRPDFFWTPKIVSVLSVKGTGRRYICFKDYNDKSDNIGYYGISKEQKEKMQDEINLKTSEILSEIKSFKSDFEKELFIHDYLCKNIVYDDEAASDLQNSDSDSLGIYGALVEGKAVCEGYSEAMQYLCLKAGLDCSVVCGEYGDTAHMWNIISIGGEFYYLDVTFDDSSDFSPVHKYFNITKKQAEDEHFFYEEFLQNKSYSENENFNFFNDDCNNDNFNYYEYNNAYITNDCAAALNTVIYAAQNGQTQAELENRTSLSADEAVKLIISKLRVRVVINRYYNYGDNVIILMW